jgi:hypothetical protein
MGELALQQTRLVDVATAQKIGKQIGAFVILTGTIAPKGNGQSDVNVRLIDVSTGKILMAVSQPINNEWMSATPPANNIPAIVGSWKSAYDQDIVVFKSDGTVTARGDSITTRRWKQDGDQFYYLDSVGMWYKVFLSEDGRTMTFSHPKTDLLTRQ